jgi:hypothetical protein
MKMKTVLFALLAAVLMMGGCDKIVNITFDSDIKADLEVYVPEDSFKADINGAFSVSKIVDPLSDPEVEKYINNIKGWDVTGISGEVISVSKEGVSLVSADIEVLSDNDNATWHLPAPPAIPLVVGQEISLDNTNGQWDAINNILNEKKEFTVSMSGVTDQGDVTFVIRIIISTEVEASPL